MWPRLPKASPFYCRVTRKSPEVWFLLNLEYTLCQSCETVSAIQGFHSTDMHVKKSLTHALRNVEGSGVQIGSCQTLWPVADLSLDKQIVYKPRYDICGWTMMTGKSMFFLFIYSIWCQKFWYSLPWIRRHKVTLYWEFLKSWKKDP